MIVINSTIVCLVLMFSGIGDKVIGGTWEPFAPTNNLKLLEREERDRME